MSRDRDNNVARRTFLGRVTAAAAAFGAMVGGTSVARAETPQPAPGWQPTRHPEDDWFEQTAAKHRFFMDTTTATGLGAAMAYARNFFEASAAGYKLTDADSAQIICLRHHSTSFAFADAMWAKYGAELSERGDYVDPETKKAPAVNPYEVEGRGGDRGVTLSSLAKRGVRYAVCSMATRRAAALIAQRSGGKADDIFRELTEHLVPNARLVPAGVVAVSRAQERGYTSLDVM